jgi:hypothetical protein
MSESVKLWVCLIDWELMFRSFFCLALQAGGGEGLNKDLTVGLDGARTTPISLIMCLTNVQCDPPYKISKQSWSLLKCIYVQNYTLSVIY